MTRGLDLAQATADAEMANPGDTSAPPSFSVTQIVKQLRTSWGGQAEGTTFDWANVPSVNYYVGGTPLANGSTEIPGLVAMTPFMQARADLAFELWDDLMATSLNKVTTAAENQIQFEYSSATNGGGTYAKGFGSSYRSDSPYGGTSWNNLRSELWFNSTWESHNQDSDMYFGGYGMQTYLHEIGHALGLSHPGKYNFSEGTELTYAANAEYAQDTRQFSLMSYFGGYSTASSGWTTTNGDYYSATPMIDDISAIQAIYGADMTTRTGNTVYGWNATADRAVFDFANYGSGVPIFAIWDGGGLDEIDASRYTQNQRIDLADGAYSSVGGFTDNIAIARNAVIENAFGGSGNDFIYGNAAVNVLRGAVGNDFMDGKDGNDSLFGWTGMDTLYGGLGNDRLDGEQDNDRLFGFFGEDLLLGGDGNDELHGEQDNDTLYGFFGNDTLYGGGGNDRAFGEAGEDLVFGGDGDDQIGGNDANDRLFGEGGNDTVWGDGGDDQIGGNDGNDRLFGFAGNDTLWGDNGDDALRGGSENDRLFGFANNDFVDGEEGDDFVNGGTGNDTVYGGAGTDDLSGDAGDDFIWGLTGNDVLNGGGGNDILGGEAGNDTFVFFANANADRIIGFEGGGGVGDIIRILGQAAFDTFAEVQAAATVVDNILRINLTGTTITLEGYANFNQLNADDFLFA